jgi:hypothetical protein
MSAKLVRDTLASVVVEEDARILEPVEEACKRGPVEAEEGIGRGNRARGRVVTDEEGSTSAQGVVGRGNVAAVVHIGRPGELRGKVKGKVRGKVAGDVRGEVISGHKWVPSAEAKDFVED